MMQRLRSSINKVTTAAEHVYDVCQVVEPDVLASIAAAVGLLLIKTLAPETKFWASVLTLLSYWFLFLSVTASWGVARRFVQTQTDEDWEMSRDKSLVFVLGPSVLGMPTLCSIILPFTFPAYTRQWAMYHFLAALFPSLWIAITGKRVNSLPTVASSQSESDAQVEHEPIPLATRKALFRLPTLPRFPSRRAKAALPLRVAILRGLRLPRASNAPRIHPLMRRYMYRPTSDLKFEVAEEEVYAEDLETVA